MLPNCQHKKYNVILGVLTVKQKYNVILGVLTLKQKYNVILGVVTVKQNYNVYLGILTVKQKYMVILGVLTAKQNYNVILGMYYIWVSSHSRLFVMSHFHDQKNFILFTVKPPNYKTVLRNHLFPIIII